MGKYGMGNDNAIPLEHNRCYATISLVWQDADDIAKIMQTARNLCDFFN